jgi:GMP synthase (glutamine-hydrolysing)
MDRVLSIDFEPRLDLPIFQGPRWLPGGTPHVAVKACQEPIPDSCEEFSHIILSGSTCSILDSEPFLEPAMALVRDAVKLGRPVLGICYGHQLAVRAMLGRPHVRRAPAPEIGWLPITVESEHDTLFEGLSDPFYAFVGHFDEVCDLPDDWEITASTAGCPIQGVLNPSLRIMGFQFHPEMDIDVGNTCYATDREVLERLGFDVGAMIDQSRDDGSGRLLIPRFLDRQW